MAYYTPSGLPANQTREISSQIRNEYALIQAGFSMLPASDALWSGYANYAVDSGAANAYAITLAATYVTAYVDGQTLSIKATAANTGASTLNVNALGIKSIVRADGTDLQSGEIGAGQVFGVIYSSTLGKFILSINPTVAVTSAESAAASAATATAAASSATASASSANASAIAAAASAASIAGGPVASVNGMTGIVTIAGMPDFVLHSQGII